MVWDREQPALVAAIMAPVVNMPSVGIDVQQAESVIAYLLRRRAASVAIDMYRVQFCSRREPVGQRVQHSLRLVPSATRGGGAGSPGLVGEISPDSLSRSGLEEAPRARLT